MSADRTHSPTSNSPPQRRPSLSDIFSKPNSANMSSATGNSSFPNPITTAAASNAQSNRRRMSITTLGLSGSPTQPSPFGSIAGRRESVSSSESFEDAIDDSDNSPGNNPTSPFARRVSFGAQALRDVRGGNGTANGRYPSSGSSPLATSYHTASSTSSAYTRDNPSSFSSLSSSSSAAAGTGSNNLKNERSDRLWRPLGEGFNWSAALRTRAERAPSHGGSFPASAQPQPLMNQNDINHSQAYHQRAASIAIMEQPTREMPKESRQKKPDFFQEKILRADFMD
ncbi:hypothetical protein UA08_03925 [Talaromyces atroroseus]|uniref:Uncharacterized protein n=1 Tax=Talaromyces atroroseus TaxID=1441469 RepID=A0A225AII7_TALAT|nr:hypothetical protein UA08_03925 [Talaromyces atroroseus]OKL61262.1 hypothetical protein UA08_03925 [Talaromyces atroroseus]